MPRRFSGERWQAFKRDLAFLIPRVGGWPAPFLDHGHNDPPTRALLLHLLLRHVPANVLTLTLLTSLDYLVIVTAFCAMWWAFGAIPAALAAAFFSLSFFARFDFIGGSLLRWDWVAALLVGLAAFARGFGATAGICFGYAALARIFPILFLVPLGLKWLERRRASSQEDAVGRPLGVALGFVLVVAVGLAAVGESRALLLEYVSKIGVHTAVPSINRVGLGALLTVNAAPWRVNPDGVFEVTQAALVAARPAAYVVPLVAVLYLLAAWPLIRRARALESVMYAVPLVFFALSPATYYYSFLVLLVLLPWQRETTDRARLVEMAFLTFTMAVSWAFVLAADGILTLYYQVSIQTGLFFLFWIGLEYLRLASPDATRKTVNVSLGAARAAR